MTIDEKLDFWLKNNWNVLMVGTHGIGKTAIVSQAFDRAKLNWQYFSAPTMDPWVDFIGVPKEKIDPITGKSYLTLIRPQSFENDEVEAIFIDEFNRAPDKVTNALMELIQFKTINGRSLKNLRVVWAAINPADETGTYHVEELDPAIQDRFHIQIELPADPNRQYFTNKYGDTIGNKAVDWWNEVLPKAIQPTISPRRLDCAVEVFIVGGDLSDVLPKQARPDTLRKKLEQVGVSNDHTTRWLDDPDLYIKQLSHRSDNTDIVAAMSALCDISMDQAVNLVGRLPAPKLNLLAQSNKTMVLLLKCYINDKSSRRFVTAIVTAGRRKYEEVILEAHEYVELNIVSAAPNTLLDVMFTVITSTNEIESTMVTLINLLHREIEAKTLTYGCCEVLMVIADKKTPPDIGHKIINIVANYVLDYHTDQVLHFIRINPYVICNNLK